MRTRTPPENPVNAKFAELHFRSCLKSLASPNTNVFQAYESGQRRLSYLRYITDFYP